MTRVSLTPVLVLSLWGASYAWAQTSAAARCDSVVAAARMDSLPVAIFIRSVRIGGDLDLDQSLFITRAIASAFIPPRPFRLSVFSGPSQMRALRRLTTDSVGGLRAPTVTGVYRYSATKDRLLGRIETLRTSLVPGFDSAAIEAIGIATNLREVRSPRDDADSVRVEVRFSPDSMIGAYRLATADFPRMPVVDAVPNRDNPPPEFPASAKEDSLVGGEVVLRFVVDASGRAAPGTVEVARASRIDFLQAALASLPAQRFSPASIRGCAVAQVVDYSFSFVLPTDGKPPSVASRLRD